MSDERLRRLERLVASGDPEAQERLLVERVRSKTLVPGGLQLLARLGHSYAREALGRDAPRPTEHLDRLGLALQRWGQEPWVRAAVTAARLAAEHLPAGAALDTRAVEMLEASGSWIQCPCDQHATAARRRAKAPPAPIIGRPVSPQAYFSLVARWVAWETGPMWPHEPHVIRSGLANIEADSIVNALRAEGVDARREMPQDHWFRPDPSEGSRVVLDGVGEGLDRETLIRKVRRMANLHQRQATEIVDGYMRRTSPFNLAEALTSLDEAREALLKAELPWLLRS